MTTTQQSAGHIVVEGETEVLVAHLHGGPHALFDPEMARQLKAPVDRADRDPAIRAVVFTGTHPDRFLSHSDVRWLQRGGTGFPPINTRMAKLAARSARLSNRLPGIRALAGKTRLASLLQLDSFHATFLKMNASGTIFVAALNGSVGSEQAFAFGPMLEYIATTEATGELPMLHRETYTRALAEGRFGGDPSNELSSGESARPRT